MVGYEEWQWEAELVREVSLLHSGRIHVRIARTGVILCGQSGRKVEYLDEMPARRVDLPLNMHVDCMVRIPE
jgi:hypothetical protein